jgi:hypothetical protein
MLRGFFEPQPNEAVKMTAVRIKLGLQLADRMSRHLGTTFPFCLALPVSKFLVLPTGTPSHDRKCLGLRDGMGLLYGKGFDYASSSSQK